ncbi:DEAD-domain-containing protein [Hesseltinella vesiculosa]|uniref:ATP-dependent RNA helicase n=1 Tax=Hesseltinella vesiculosa TaxID=101127 RepID=A0A1X2GV77_9FUNG|nr:DEAD-domain-containing protein [Hesseltinella vesiculosa]
MDDDGMMLNLVPGKAKASDSQDPKQSTRKKDEKDQSGGKKVIHGKVQVQSSLFTANPEYDQDQHKDNTVSSKDQQPSNAPTANMFESLGISNELIQVLNNKLQVTRPTLVQQRALPVLLGPAQGVQAISDPLPDTKKKGDVDVVVQAQTGSGKTLTYLLPMLQRLVAASTFNSTPSGANFTGFGSRAIGTVAIILTPTRELAQQVTNVLNQLLTLPRPADAYRRTHWMVAGMVIGGDSKAKEKARLRKGVTFLVSTPGRLLDHLQNTQSFDIRHLKWLVLDEADRLLDLGFEETLKQIMQLIQEKTKAEPLATYRHTLTHPLWPRGHQTILCSATLRDDVRQLAGTALVDPVFVNANGTPTRLTAATPALNESDNADDAPHTFSAPTQLQQTYTIVPAKLRLVSLIAFLRNRMKKKQAKSGKIIVFFSCCDSVDFHYDLLAHAGNPLTTDVDEDREDMLAALEDDDVGDSEKKTGNKKRPPRKTKKVREQEQLDFQRQPCQESKLLGDDVRVYRLHGDLPQDVRSSTFQQFNDASNGILLCTDVAARGLDLPNVACIIQYDPPTDMKDYVHRIGRTARLGKAGEARLFLLPSEMDYLPILKAQGMAIAQVTVESLLADTFGKLRHVYEAGAQETQDQLERYVLSEEENVILGRKAYWSSIRAYATHGAAEKHVFHVKKLHLGHIAKSFALREAPSQLQDPNKTKKKKDAKQERMPGKMKFRDGKQQPGKQQSGKQGKQQPGKQQQGKKGPGLGKRKRMGNADEFAIISSASTLAAGPTTKKKKLVKN